MDTRIYGDENFLVGRSEGQLQNLLNAVADAGAEAGMELLWKKFQLLQTKHDTQVRGPMCAISLLQIAWRIWEQPHTAMTS
eukprot:3348400-Pyramimonas_sp.AAC.1